MSVDQQLQAAMGEVRGQKPRRLYQAMRDEAAMRPTGFDPRRRLLFIAARALVLLEADDATLRETLKDAFG